jgi:hypothetical protein
MIDKSSLEGHHITSRKDGVKCECGAQFENRKEWVEHLVDKRDE